MRVWVFVVCYVSVCSFLPFSPPFGAVQAPVLCWSICVFCVCLLKSQAGLWESCIYPTMSLVLRLHCLCIKAKCVYLLYGDVVVWGTKQ